MGFVYLLGIVNVNFKLTILNKARLGPVVDAIYITSLFWVRILVEAFSSFVFVLLPLPSDKEVDFVT